ncbi:MAG: aromatic-ring-hydroxylating dioxygenase subunit beta [Cystobacter sp.]
MNDPWLRSRVEDLLYAYAEALDDGPLEDWPGFFTEQARYRLIPWENHQQGLPASLMLCTSRAMMEDRVVAIREASVFPRHVCRHLYTNVRVEDAAREGHARARANYAVFRTFEDGETGVLSVGRVLAEVVLEPQPRFTQMDVVYEAFRIPGLLVYPI